MIRKPLSGVLLLALLAAPLVGCSTCQSCYDYCGPVVDDCGQPTASFMQRRNSLYTPTADTPPETLVNAAESNRRNEKIDKGPIPDSQAESGGYRYR